MMIRHEDCRLKDIVNCLQKAGIKAYLPHTNNGQVKEKQVFVKISGSESISNPQAYALVFELLCYVPEDEYSDIEHYLERVKRAMVGLWPEIKSNGSFSSAVMWDDYVRAWYYTLEYINYRANITKERI